MQKLINDPKDFVDQTLEGILAAYPNMLKTAGGDLRCIVKAGKIKNNKVT